jgi:hypothetical protein
MMIMGFLKEKYFSLIWQRQILLCGLIFLIACSGGEVSVSSLGGSIAAPGLYQNGASTTQVIINASNKVARYSVECDQYAKQIEFSYDGINWIFLQDVQCQDGHTNIVQFVSSDFTNTKAQGFIRIVSERGISEIKTFDFYIGHYVVLEQLAALQSPTGTEAGYINSLNVEIEMFSQFSYDLSDTAAKYSASEVYLTSVSSCQNGGDWQTFANKVSYQLKTRNAVNELFLKFRDLAFNESPCLSLSVVHDDLAPQLVDFNVVPGTQYLRNNNFSITAAGSGDYEKMLITPNGQCIGHESLWESFDFGKSGIAVVALNAINIMSMQIRDRAGNLSNCLSDTFIHDNTPPATPTMTLLSAASPSTNANPTLRLRGLAIGDSVLAYTDGSCSQQIYGEAQATETESFFNASLSANGNYPISMILTDPAGNTTGCIGPLLLYIYDTQAPNIALLQANGNAMPSGFLNQTQYEFKTQFSSDATYYRYKTGASGATDCLTSTAYSVWTPVSQNIIIDSSGVGDGAFKICVQGKDGAGNIANAIFYTWNIITSSPIVQWTGTPSSTSKITILNVDVLDSSCVSYRYKVGASATTDCAAATDYGVTDILPTTHITASILGVSDGSITLCVIGKNSSAVEQPYSLATSVSWIKDTTGPSLLAPVMTAGVSRPVDGNYVPGDLWAVTTTFNEPIITQGSLFIQALIGGSTRKFSYASKPSSNQLQFVYRTTTSDSGQFGFLSSLNIPTNSVTDLAGNSLVNSTVTSGYYAGVVASSVTPVYSFAEKELLVKEDVGVVSVIINSSLALGTNNNLELSLEPPIPTGATGPSQATPGSDFDFNSQNIVFPAGQTSMSFNIPITNDSDFESPVERLTLQLKGADRGEIITQGSGNILQVMIRDNESANFGASELFDFDAVSNTLCFKTSEDKLYCLGNQAEGATLTASLMGYVKTAIQVGTNVDFVYRGSLANSSLIKKNDGSFIDYHLSTITPLSGLNNITEVFKSSGRFCFKDNAQLVYCNSALSREIPSATLNNPPIAIQPVRTEALDGLKYLKVLNWTGYWTACALGDFDLNINTSDTVRCWGYHTDGVRGNGLEFASSSAIFNEISLGNIKGITNGYLNYCIWGDLDFNLGTGDSIACWGRNNTLQSGGPSTTSDVTTPTGILALTNVNLVVASDDGYSFCASGEFDSGRTGKEAACWGRNNNGQLGNSATANLYNPYILAGVSDVSEIYGLTSAFCARTTIDNIYCWGAAFTNTPTALNNLPALPWQSVLAKGSSICILSLSGALSCYGALNFQIASNVSQFIVGTNKVCYLQNESVICKGTTICPSSVVGTALPIFSGLDVASLVDHSKCVRLNGKSELYCAGSNNYFSLGGTNTATQFGPFTRTKIPALGKTLFGYYPNCHLATDGAFNCWARHPANSNATGEINPITLASSVSSFALAIESPSTIYGFGAHIESGVLKYWSMGNAQNVGGFASGAIAIAGGNAFFCGIENSLSKKVYCWGANSLWSPLGNGAEYNSGTATYNHVNPSSPVEAIGVLDAQDIVSGTKVTCVRKSDKTIMCWGHQHLQTAFAPSLIDVESVKINTLDRVCVRTGGGYLSCTVGALVGPSALEFTQVSNEVLDFWFFGTDLCYKKNDGVIYCNSNLTPSDFGRYYDSPQETLW